MSWSMDDYCPIIHKDLSDIILENTIETYEYLYNVLGIYYTFQIHNTDYKYIKIISDKHQDLDNELSHFAISLPEEIFNQGYYFDGKGCKIIISDKVTTLEEVYEMTKDSVSEICSLEYIKTGKNPKTSMNKIRLKTTSEFLSKPNLFNSRKKYLLQKSN